MTHNHDWTQPLMCMHSGLGTAVSAADAPPALWSANPDAGLDDSCKIAMLQHLGLADDGKPGVGATRHVSCAHRTTVSYLQLTAAVFALRQLNLSC